MFELVCFYKRVYNTSIYIHYIRYGQSQMERRERRARRGFCDSDVARAHGHRSARAHSCVDFDHHQSTLSYYARVSIYLSPDRAASFDDNNYHNPPSHSKSLSSRILDLVADMLPLLRRFGKAALAIEVTAAAGLYLVYRDLNSGGPEARSKWDRRVGPWLVDAFHAATGDDRVVDHRRPHPNPAFGKGGDP